MFIQTETTPNPETLKFIPGKTVLEQGTANFESRDDAAASPLAQALFAIDGVEGVFLGKDFISVTKATTQQWPTLKPALLTTIMEHFVSGIPVILDTKAQSSQDENREEDSSIVKQLKEIIETKVRPAVAQDGGDIIFKHFDEVTGVVSLELHGACAGCPSSTITLKHGIENMLKHYVPEVTSVEAVA